MIRYSAMSSANLFTSLPEEMQVATSLIYVMKTSGPKTDPGEHHTVKREGCFNQFWSSQLHLKLLQIIG